MKELSEKIQKDLAAITFKYTWDADELEAELPKDFNLAKYLTDDFEIDEEKLKADIKDEKLIKAILTHAGEDDLDIATFKLSAAYEKTPEEFNEEVMEEIYGKKAAEILKEYGVYWPGIEKAIEDGIIDEHLKVFKKDVPNKNQLIYEIYKKYCTLPEDYCIVPKKGKFIKFSLKNIAGQKFKNPIIFHKNIALKNIGFYYASDDRVNNSNVLDKINFKITKGSKVLIVEDVITTGKSSLECVKLIKKTRAKLVGFACIIDRSSNSVSIKDKIVSRMQFNIETFSEDKIPEDLKKIQPTKPGSRNLSK